MHRVAFVIMSLPEDAPYISYYEKYLFKKGINIDYIVWDRKSLNKIFPPNFYVFKRKSPLSSNLILKLFDMIAFGQFANKILSNNNYSKVVIFTIQTAIFLYRYLNNNNCKYIIDIRDYSPTLNYKIFRNRFFRIIHNSYATVISSPKFKDFLPTTETYYISHNIDSNLIRNVHLFASQIKGAIKILIIGQIRDFSENWELIEKLANKPQFRIFVAGKGAIYEKLELQSRLHKISNVKFFGSYDKSQEINIYDCCDLVYAYTSENFNSFRLLTNRIYLSALCCKPIIVNKNTYQGEIVDQFHLGIAVDNLQNIDWNIIDYIKNHDSELFRKGQRAFFHHISNDFSNFEKLLRSFFDNTK